MQQYYKDKLESIVFNDWSHFPLLNLHIKMCVCVWLVLFTKYSWLSIFCPWNWVWPSDLLWLVICEQKSLVSFSIGSFKSKYTICLILLLCKAIAETLTGSLHQPRSLGKDDTEQRDIWHEQEINFCFFKPLRFEGCSLLQHNPANHNWFYIYIYIWCIYHTHDVYIIYNVSISYIYKYKYIHPLVF